MFSPPGPPESRNEGRRIDFLFSNGDALVIYPPIIGRQMYAQECGELIELPKTSTSSVAISTLAMSSRKTWRDERELTGKCRASVLAWAWIDARVCVTRSTPAFSQTFRICHGRNNVRPTHF